MIYGISLDNEASYPLRHSSIPLNERNAAFIRWVSAYFTPLPDGVAISAESLQARVELTVPAPTLLTLPPDEFEDLIELTAIEQSSALLDSASDIRLENTRRTFLDADEVLPHVSVVILWCEQSVSFAMWAAKFLHELLGEEITTGKTKRKASIVKMSNANHFVRHPLDCCALVLLNILHSITGNNRNKWFGFYPK